MISLDPDLAGNVAEEEEVDPFAETKRVPDYKLPRKEKLRRAGVTDDSETQEIAQADKEELELGYSASDSSESEYEAGSQHVEGQPPEKKKKAALRAYQKKAGKNVVDPTVVCRLSFPETTGQWVLTGGYRPGFVRRWLCEDERLRLLD